ncbi:MAG: carotenoid biosynthesis protein [Verrucomicrobium sp.]|nr:carotenoid biosynthesis protein [Verrucomicrobium sp.]
MTRARVERAVFGLYAVWMAVGLALTWRRAAVGPWGDVVLMALAAAVVHLALEARWGAGPARRWLALVLAASAAVEILGVRTGFPFGAYAYTGAFGFRLGPLPAAIPLAWYAVLGGWLAAVAPAPRLSRALLAGGWAAVFDALLEPFAVQVKGYWIWQTPDGQPPAQNFIAWAAVGFLLALAAPRDAGRASRRPAAVLGSMLVLFELARFRYGI